MWQPLLLRYICQCKWCFADCWCCTDCTCMLPVDPHAGGSLTAEATPATLEEPQMLLLLLLLRPLFMTIIQERGDATRAFNSLCTGNYHCNADAADAAEPTAPAATSVTYTSHAAAAGSGDDTPQGGCSGVGRPLVLHTSATLQDLSGSSSHNQQVEQYQQISARAAGQYTTLVGAVATEAAATVFLLCHSQHYACNSTHATEQDST